jgi:hypothetical protein
LRSEYLGGSKISYVDEHKNLDIQNVMKEEISRGNRRVDTKALQLTQARLKLLREVLKSETEREFVEAIRALGLADDTEKLREALKIWRASV